METISLKTLAIKHLQGNRRRNIEETSGLPSGKLKETKTAGYYKALAEFESFTWLDGQPIEVIEEHYPKLQAALDRVRHLYAEMNRQGIKVSVTTKEMEG